MLKPRFRRRRPPRLTACGLPEKPRSPFVCHKGTAATRHMRRKRPSLRLRPDVSRLDSRTFFRWQSMIAQGCRQQFLRSGPGFVAESERTPVRTESLMGSAIEHDANGFVGIGMLILHEPTGLVRADRQDSQVRRPETRANVGENSTIAVSGITHVIDTCRVRPDDETTPQRHSAIAE